MSPTSYQAAPPRVSALKLPARKTKSRSTDRIAEASERQIGGDLSWPARLGGAEVRRAHSGGRVEAQRKQVHPDEAMQTLALSPSYNIITRSPRTVSQTCI